MRQLQALNKAVEHSAFEPFYGKLLPFIFQEGQKYEALGLTKLPLLDRPGVIALTQEQASCILANM